MRISTKGGYGIRAMYELAMAHGQGPVPLKVVAEKQALSEHYLEQLMGTLRKAGLVKGVRGAKGGYQLALPPEKISVGDVIRALEGPIAPVSCVDLDAEAGCERHATCPTRGLWERLRDSMIQVLDSTTLADLCREAPQNAAPKDSGKGLCRYQGV
ncbi:MAG TPA: Rrf2 family transcriptional regulator [Firmicutes bacterium]|nr:Rrf2 family transcriptional regulator [Bacillota bacterium]